MAGQTATELSGFHTFDGGGNPGRAPSVEAKLHLDGVASSLAQGDWDPSSGSFPAGSVRGYQYTVAGTPATIGGQTFEVGTVLTALTDNASTSVFAGNWSVSAGSGSVQSVAGFTGSVDAGDIANAIDALPDINILSDADVANIPTAGQRATLGLLTATSPLNLDDLADDVANVQGAILASSPIYPDVATGLAATSPGDQFQVENADPAIAYDIYEHEVGGTSRLVASPVAGSALINAPVSQAQQEALDPLISALSEAIEIGHTDAIIPSAPFAADNASYAFADPVATDGRITAIHLFASNAGALSVRVWSLDPATSTFTQVREQTVNVAAGFDSYPVDLNISAGEHLGFHGNGIIALSNTPADAGGWFGAGAGGTSFTDATVRADFRFHIRYDVEVFSRLDVLDDCIAQNKTGLAALRSDVFPPAVLENGPSKPIAAGNGDMDNGLFALEVPLANNAEITGFYCYAVTPGPARLIVWDRSVDTFTVAHEETVDLVAGYQEIPISIDAVAGQYLGVQSTHIGTLSGVNDATGWFGGGGVNSFTDGTINKTTRLLFGFDIASETTELVSQLRPSSVDLPTQNLFIIGAGQSLGEGSDGAVTNAQEYDTKTFTARDAAPTAIFDATVTTSQFGTRGEYPLLGAAGALRQSLLRENGISYQSVKSTIVIANNAVGGATLAQISKGTTSYAAGVAQAAALATITGETASTIGVNFMQGESDAEAFANTDEATYKAAMIQLAKDYDTDVRAASGQDRRVPLFTYQMNATGRKIGRAHLEASIGSPLIYCVGPMYQHTYYDTLHINAASSRIQGGYIAQAIKAVSMDGEDFEPLRPIASSVLGNTITLTFNKSGLNLDSTLMVGQVNSGFFVNDAGGTAVTVSSVAVINDNQVRLTCATAPAPDWSVGYGIPAVGRSDSFVGNMGNLRDSAGDAVAFDGVPLHNWSVVFDWKL